MAFYIKLSNGQEFTWNLPAPKPAIPNYIPSQHRGVIAYMQVDGDELNHIRDNFDNIPNPHKGLAKYPAPWAELIFLNL